MEILTMEENSEGSWESNSALSHSMGEGTEISQLPSEVLLEIFTHVDGKGLLMCKRVCKSWRDHVHHLEQNPLFWYNHCQKDIPSGTQFDLLDNMYPSHWKDQNQVDWEEVYKCWYSWNSLSETPDINVYKLVAGIRGISSIKVSGEWLLITTCEFGGKLIGQRFSKSGLVDLYVGGGAILNFKLVTSDSYTHSNVKSGQLKEVFDTLGHNEIRLELKDCYIQLGRSYCHHLDKIQQRISHSYGYEVRLISPRNNCSSVILKKTCNKVHGPELMELGLSSSYSHILDFWMNTVSLCGIRGNNIYGKEVMFDAFSVNRRTQEASLIWSLDYDYNSQGYVYETYSWHGSLFVVYNNKRTIMIHAGGKEKVQVTPIKKGCVTSVLFYANYFFLGTDRGKLLIHHVKGPEDCLKIDVYKTPALVIEVCENKICHLAVAEPVHHKRKGPVILCGTPEDVYMVTV